MVDRIIEIAEDGRYLSVYRGFFEISSEKKRLGRIPLADVVAVILTANQATVSKNVVAAFAEHNIALVVCGAGYLPVSIALPYSGNYESGQRMRDQINAGRPLRKRLWQALVQEKLRNQAAVLQWRGAEVPARKISGMVAQVRSGDPENYESRAARIYWAHLFRPRFRRDRFAEDENIFFNYIYTVLRSATARSLVGAGLLPALGLHHRGRLNPYALVDDVMEPFRPLADSLVVEIWNHGKPVVLTPEVKQHLVRLLRLDMRTRTGISPVNEVLHRLAMSLVRSFTEKKQCLEFAEMLLPEKRPGQGRRPVPS